MDGANLVLMNNDGARAAVTWPLVGRSDQPVAGWLRHGERWLDFDQWASISGLGAERLLRQIPVLFSSGIIDPRGTVDPLALAFARRLAGERVEKRKKR